ncbi:MAG: hypothetical protein WCV93_01180 [Candidatus Shapirobacteria bacterium]|jgi:hypothetical protein
MFWHDVTLGTFDPINKGVGLDYRNLFHDPILVETILAHEGTHYAISETTEFGQATHSLFKLQDSIVKIDPIEYENMLGIIYNSQIAVQEGFATLMELLRRKSKTSKAETLSWASQNLPLEYQRWVNPMLFVLDLSSSYRDQFTAKVSHLAMTTSIRRDIPKLNLLSDINKLRDYLDEDDNNPNKRLNLLVNTLSSRPWMCTKDNNTLLKESGLYVRESVTKPEIASFLTYLTSFTDNPYNFSETDIGDPVPDSRVFIDAFNNTFVANMNLDFTKNGVVIYDHNKYVIESKNFEAITAFPREGRPDLTDYLRRVSTDEPEVDIIGFTKTGTSFLTTTSKKKAKTLIESLDCPFFVRYGDFDNQKNTLFWMPDLKTPDFIVYRYPENLNRCLGEILKARPAQSFKHVHIGSSEGSPLQTLIVKSEGIKTFHVVNTYGNVKVGEIIKSIQAQSAIMSNDDINNLKTPINCFFSIWSGMGWKLDWVEILTSQQSET